MSDDEFMMDDAEDEDYGFEYEDDDEEAGEADLENDYYIAKGHKSDNPEQAIKEFEAVIAKEEEPGEWGFKCLKQLTKLTFKLKRFDESLRHYTRLLPYTRKAVTRNVAEKAINGILDYVSAAPDLDLGLMQRFYEETLTCLTETKNERLSMKTNLKLAKLWLDRKEYDRLTKILRQIQSSITAQDSASADSDMTGADNTRGTMLLEIYALEIQMYGETRNNKKLREIYEKTTQVRSAIPHPRINGVIRECGGKMHMDEKEWAKAQVDFFEAFKSYDEAGSFNRTTVLKYLVLAHMLMNSQINPFDSQETKPYKNDPEIVAMTNLVDAYQSNNVLEAEKIIKENKSTMSDPFIQSHIAEVLRSLRTQWILDIIRPYTRIEIDYLAKQLSIPTSDVEDIIVSQILDGKIEGRIDQTTQQLELNRHKQVDTKRYEALARWTRELSVLHSTIVHKAAQTGPTMPGGPGLPTEMRGRPGGLGWPGMDEATLMGLG